MKPELADWVRAEYRFEIHELLRYEIFDIGRLLIRHDPKGYRNDQWRKVVSELFDDAATGLKDLAQHGQQDMKMLFDGAFAYLDYHLLKIGEAVLDPEQAQVFEVRLNRAMNHAQNRLAMRLILNGQQTGLEPFSWMSSCGTDNRPEYRFEVSYGPDHAVAYVDGKLRYLTAGCVA